MESGTPHPLAQGGLGQRHPAAGGDLFDPIEREMISELADHHPSQKPRGGHAAFNQCRGDRRRGDRFAMTASILWTDMTMDRELGGFDIQLFGDVCPDLDQILAALTTSTGFQVMAMVDARQMVREWLTPRPGSGLSGLCLFGI